MSPRRPCASSAEQVSAAHGAASGGGDEGVDGTLHGLGVPGSVRATGTASHASGSSARGRSHGGTGQASGAGDHRSGKAGIAAGAGSGEGFTGSARLRRDFGGDDCGRVGADLALRYCTAVDGLQRRGSQRGLQPGSPRTGLRPWGGSGKRKQRGSITKTGNAHLRRIVVEAAWSYRHRPAIGPRLRKRQEGVAEPIKEIAWKAQGKDQRKIITAVGRELLGFIWAIGVKVGADSKLRMAA
jgi:hypothetical protein